MLRKALRIGGTNSRPFASVEEFIPEREPASSRETTPKRFTLHGHFMSGPTYKIGLMLSLCGEPFAFKLIDLRGGEQKQPEFLALNRYGQVPCLMDEGLAICQSPSILIHLADTLGKFNGATAAERTRIREWMFWEHDKLAPGIYRSRGQKLGFFNYEPQAAALLRGDGEAGLQVLDGWLAKHEWLVGSGPTIADIDVYGVVHLATEGGFDLSKWPNVLAWTKRVEALPGYGPRDTLMPKETTL